jgi:hypothetical protein
MTSGGTSGSQEAGLVGDHDGLDAVATVGLAQHVRDVGLDRVFAQHQLGGDLEFESRRATSFRTSSSRGVNSATAAGAEISDGAVRANSRSVGA